MAVRRQSSVTGQPNVLDEAAVAALRFGIPAVSLFTCHWPDQTPGQTEPQLMDHITQYPRITATLDFLIFQKAWRGRYKQT